MNPRLTILALASLLVGGALAFMASTRPSSGPLPAPTSTKSSGTALIGGPFSLIDTTGRPVTDKDFQGRYMLVFFGYTFCPDVCPASLQVITAALDQLGPEANAITPVLITLDPARDSPEKLAAYLKSFHPRFVGLTGSAEQVKAAVKAYRAYAKIVPDERNPADYTLDHTSIVYLMNPAGNMVAFAPDATKVDVLVAQIRKGLAVGK
jgi:protein SCO1